MPASQCPEVFFWNIGDSFSEDIRVSVYGCPLSILNNVTCLLFQILFDQRSHGIVEFTSLPWSIHGVDASGRFYGYGWAFGQLWQRDCSCEGGCASLVATRFIHETCISCFIWCWCQVMSENAFGLALKILDIKRTFKGTSWRDPLFVETRTYIIYIYAYGHISLYT